MFTNTKDLKELVIRASDGELGAVDQLYFDDETWALRYLTVSTGGWFGGREVLISPMSIIGADWASKRLDVALTMKQVEESPDIDTHRPVSRQQEAAYLSYYGFPFYWDGPHMGGKVYFAAGATSQTDAALTERSEKIRREPTDVHLRSTEEVTGYHIEATDGEIGHIDSFIVDEDAWAIRYLEVATKNWWPGKKVLLAPGWVERVSWEQSKVFVGLTRKAIKDCEEYVDGTPITREYENRVYFHYGRPPYWMNQATGKSSQAVSGA